ncbi:MAG: metallophosphoesterase [Candidatus Dormibacteraeota bacterium]|nr:metallophosphoesterase [Candidatus Dormibacteraeota bacterium]
MAAIERVLLTGDVHGNTSWMVGHVLKQAKRHGCQLVLQLGDFGIWPGKDGQHYLEVLNREYKHAGIPLWFIDGNHEDFDQLYALPLDGDGRRPVREFITHIPRGHRWQWAGREMLACGGASSIDADLRTPGRSWWPQEAITDDDVARCIAGGGTAVMFSHDIQLEVQLTDPHEQVGAPDYVMQGIRANRTRLQRIADATLPSLQVHGHWHVPYDETFTRKGVPLRIVGLNCDSRAASEPNGHCAVLDLATLAEDVREALLVVD